MEAKPKVKQFKDDLDQKQLKGFNEMKAKIIEESKTLLKDISAEQLEKYQEENQIVRLLYAREFQVEKSMKMWRKWVNWRMEFKADEIKEEDVARELQSGKAFWHGFDKLGNPVLVVKVKFHRPGVSTQDQELRFFLYMLEEGIKKCEAAGTGKVSILWDREGFERKNFDYGLMQTFKKLNKIMQDNYAERLNTVFILNPNWFFKTIYAIFSPLLTARTKSKITIVSKNQDLLKHFEPDQLLIEHGGTSNYVYTYPFPKPTEQPIVAEKDNSNEKEEINKPKSPLTKEDEIEERKVNDNDDKEDNNSFTEADFHEIEENIIKQTEKSTNYDMDSLSSSMFEKILTIKQ